MSHISHWKSGVVPCCWLMTSFLIRSVLFRHNGTNKDNVLCFRVCLHSHFFPLLMILNGHILLVQVGFQCTDLCSHSAVTLGLMPEVILEPLGNYI